MKDSSVNLLIKELRLGFGQLSSRLDQTNARLDESILHQDKMAMSIELLRADTNAKLDGIGKYLQSINGSVQHHDERLDSLSKRVNNLEQHSD